MCTSAQLARSGPDPWRTAQAAWVVISERQYSLHVVAAFSDVGGFNTGAPSARSLVKNGRLTSASQAGWL
jgi:hypothetical protein